MKYILQLDGGGILGTIPASVLTEIETQLDVVCLKQFDLISGSSTGAILGSALAVGAPARVCRDLYVQRGVQLFTARSKWLPWNWLQPKYDRQPILKALGEVYQTYLKTDLLLMAECRTKFMCTAVSLVDERTHFFKSWEMTAAEGLVADGGRDLLTTVAHSFAAAYYFGAMDDKQAQQVWADGGEGQDNCSLRHCLIEALRQGWLPAEPVKILSLGCGYTKTGLPYAKAKDAGLVRQVKFYVNLASRQSTTDQLQEVQTVGKIIPVEVLRIDIEIPAGYNKIDAVEYIPWFDAQGRNLFGMYRKQLMAFFNRG